MRKRILMYSPNTLDGVSFYRHWGPMLALGDQVILKSFSNDYTELTNWTYFMGSDIAFMHRPHKIQDIYFIEYCKKHNLKVWADFDDDLENITEDNPVYGTFANDRARQALDFTIKNADIITTSSLILQERLKKRYRKDAILIPNAIDDRFLNLKQPFKHSRKIAWRGSQSHLADLLYHEPALCELIESHPGHNFTFFGICPFFVSRKVRSKNITYVPTGELVDFLSGFSKHNAMVQFVPLLDTMFNRVKSPLAWLDATLAGSVVVAPDFEEWQMPINLFRYKPMDLRNFFEVMENAMNSEFIKLKTMHDESWDLIQEKYLLSKTNKIRLDIINGI